MLKEKIRKSPDEEIFKSVLLKAAETAKGERIPSAAIYSEKAIRTFADYLKNKGKVPTLLLTFILPVCNQRCYDIAVFLAQENLTNEVLIEASKLRMLQAKLFGRCRLFANLKNMDALHSTLNCIADIDVSYTKMLIKGTEML